MPDLTAESIDNLISLALTSNDDDDENDNTGWRAISELQRRGTPDIFEACQSLCRSSNANERRVGIDILGQLGWSQKYPFKDDTLPILFEFITSETNIELLNSACVALGHLNDPRAIGPLLTLKDHPDVKVRHGVVFGLLALEDDRAIKALIELSNDEDELVRDWATFGLGSQLETDTPEIREALFARLTDEDEVTRGEAMVGLARRKDYRVLAPLLAEIEKMPHWHLPLEAAGELADMRLLPALLRSKIRWPREKDWVYDDFDTAIEACWGEIEI
jgi:HEAT repeat protein